MVLDSQKTSKSRFEKLTQQSVAPGSQKFNIKFLKECFQDGVGSVPGRYNAQNGSKLAGGGAGNIVSCWNRLATTLTPHLPPSQPCSTGLKLALWAWRR